MERFIALDTETTGLKISEGHRIIEIGAVEIVNREITGNEFRKYIFSNKLVGKSLDVHGISDVFLRKNGEEFKKIIHDFIAFIKDATLVIHNAPFDLGFLNHELKLIGINQNIESFCNKDKAVIDTLVLDRKENPDNRHSLDALCRRYQIDDSSRIKHGALIDSRILAKVYLKLTGGQFEVFQETTSTKSEQCDPSLIKRVHENRDKIKVIYANKDEIETHENYFQN